MKKERSQSESEKHVFNPNLKRKSSVRISKAPRQSELKERKKGKKNKKQTNKQTKHIYHQSESEKHVSPNEKKMSLV